MKFKFILSDLDGVIRNYPSERNQAIEVKHNLPIGSLMEAAFTNVNLEPAVCGGISDEQWRQSIEESLAKICDMQTARLAVSEWSNFSGTVDHEYLKFLDTSFTGVPVVVLTNGTSRLKADLQKLGIENNFFKIFNSADIGYCKPDKRIFGHVLSQLNCQPKDILYIDDSCSHIESAKELGFSVHHYKSLEIFSSAYRQDLYL